MVYNELGKTLFNEGKCIIRLKLMPPKQVALIL